MTNFLDKVMKQTIVLWATPVNDGFSDTTFVAPIEIKGRWQDLLSLTETIKNSSQVSGAIIYTKAVVLKENWVYLGNLVDLSVEQKANPKIVEGAYEVSKITSYPDLKSTESIYIKVHL